MSEINFFVDTNIILYAIQGNSIASDLVVQNNVYLSIISDIELFSFSKLSQQEEKDIKIILDCSVVVDLDYEIRTLAIEIRKKYNSKLPDAIIAATAIHYDMPLITSDKGFLKIQELDVYLFEL